MQSASLRRRADVSSPSWSSSQVATSVNGATTPFLQSTAAVGAPGGNQFGTLCPITLDAHFDVEPRAFAVQLMQRLGTTGMENLERAMRGRGPRGTTNDEFVRDSVRCLGVSASLPDSCAYPWQRKFLVVPAVEPDRGPNSPTDDHVSDGVVVSSSASTPGANRSRSRSPDRDRSALDRAGDRQMGNGLIHRFESEPMLGGFVPDVIEAHAGLNFADVSRGYPFHTAQGGSVVRRENEMSEFRRQHTSIVKQGDARIDNASLQALEPFSSVAAVEYALAILYRELDPCHADKLCWEDVASYMYDITMRGTRALPTPWASLTPLPYTRILRREGRVFGDTHEEFRLSVDEPMAAAAASFSSVLVPADTRRFYAHTTRGELLTVDARSFETKARVSAFDAAWGTISNWCHVDDDAARLIAIGTSDCALRLLSDEGEHAKLIWSQPFGTPQTAIKFIPSLRRIVSGSQSGYLSIGALPRKTEPLSADTFRMSTFFPGTTGAINDIAFVEPSSAIAAGSADGIVRLYDSDSQKPRGTDIIAGTDAVTKMDYHAHYGLLAVACGRTPSLWTPDDPRCVAATLRDAKDTHSGAINLVHFTAASPTVLTGDTTGVVKIWDLRTLSCIETHRTCGTVALVHRPERFHGDVPPAVAPQLIAVGKRRLEKLRAVAEDAATAASDAAPSAKPITNAAGALKRVTVHRRALRSLNTTKFHFPTKNEDCGVTRGTEPCYWGMTQDDRAVVWDTEGDVTLNASVEHPCPVGGGDSVATTCTPVLLQRDAADHPPQLLVGYSDGAIGVLDPDSMRPVPRAGRRRRPPNRVRIALPSPCGAPRDSTDISLMAQSHARALAFAAVRCVAPPLVLLADRADGNGSDAGHFATEVAPGTSSCVALVVRRMSASLQPIALHSDGAPLPTSLAHGAPLPAFVSRGTGSAAELASGICVWSTEHRVLTVAIGTATNAVRFVTVTGLVPPVTDNVSIPTEELFAALYRYDAFVAAKTAAQQHRVTAGDALRQLGGGDQGTGDAPAFDPDHPAQVRVSTIRSMPSAAAMSGLTFHARIGCIAGTDDSGGVHLFNLPFDKAGVMHPTCIFRTTAYLPDGAAYVPRPVATVLTHHGLLGVAAGHSIAYLDLTTVCKKALPDGWSARHEAPIDVQGDVTLPLVDAAVHAAVREDLSKRKPVHRPAGSSKLPSAAEANGSDGDEEDIDVEAANAHSSQMLDVSKPKRDVKTMERLVIDERFKVLPPTPQLVHHMSVKEAGALTGVVYDPRRQALLASGTDGRLHALSLWGAQAAVARVPRPEKCCLGGDDDSDSTDSTTSDDGNSSDSGGGGRGDALGSAERKRGGSSSFVAAVSAAVFDAGTGRLPLRSLVDDVPNPWASSVIGARSRRRKGGKALFRSAVRAIQVSAALSDKKDAMREATTLVEPLRHRLRERQDAPWRKMVASASPVRGPSGAGGSGGLASRLRGLRESSDLDPLRASVNLSDPTSCDGGGSDPVASGTALRASVGAEADEVDTDDDGEGVGYRLRKLDSKVRVMGYGNARRVLNGVAAEVNAWDTLSWPSQVQLLETLEALTGEYDDDGPFSIYPTRTKKKKTGEGDADGDGADAPSKARWSSWGRRDQSSEFDARNGRISSEPCMRDRLDLAIATLERRVLAEFRRVDDVEVSKLDRKQLAKSPAFLHCKALVLEDVNRRRDNYNALIGRRWRATTIGEAVHVQERDGGLNSSGQTPLNVSTGCGVDMDAGAETSSELFATTDPTTPRQVAPVRDAEGAASGIQVGADVVVADDAIGTSSPALRHRGFDDDRSDRPLRMLRGPAFERLHGRIAGADALTLIARRSLAESCGSVGERGSPLSPTAQLVHADDLSLSAARAASPATSHGTNASGENTSHHRPANPSVNPAESMPQRMMTPPLSRRVLHQRKSDLYYGADNRWDMPTQSEAEEALFNPLIAAAQHRRFGTRPLSATSTRSAAGSRPATPTATQMCRVLPSSGSDSRPLSAAATVVSCEASPKRSHSSAHQATASVKPRAASTGPRRDMRDNIAFQLSSVQHRVQRRPASSAGRR